MLARTLAVRWVAQYYKNVRPPALPTQRRRFEPPRQQASETASRVKSPGAPHLSNFAYPSVAHASVAQLLGSFLRKLPSSASASHLDVDPAVQLEAKVDIVPALLLMLPLPIKRDGDMSQLLEKRRIDESQRTLSTAADGSGAVQSTPSLSSSHLVCLPSERLSVLEGKSETEVSAFLASLTTAVTPANASELPPSFSPQDCARMLRLAACCRVYHVDFILRVLSELERTLYQRRDVPTQKNERASSSRPVMDGSSVSQTLFFASEIGFMDERLLLQLLKYELRPQLKRLTTRQLVFVVIALSRFHATKDASFSLAMKFLGLRCVGTRLTPTDNSNQDAKPERKSFSGNVPDADSPTSAGEEEFSIVGVAPPSSVAHPTHNISAEMCVELAKCFAESQSRSADLLTAIVHRIVSLYTDAPAAEKPKAKQLRFILDMFDAVGNTSPELDAVFLAAAAREKSGVIFDHSGSTTTEEAATYSEFHADLVKL